MHLVSISKREKATREGREGTGEEGDEERRKSRGR
jgi:hypothetical protein